VIVEARFEVTRTPDEVFEILADPSAWFGFDPALVEVEPRGPMVAGVTGTMRRRAGLGLTVKTRWANTVFVPGSRLENLITGFGYELRETIDIAAQSTGTSLTVVDTIVPTSLIGRAMVAASRGIIARDIDRRFGGLKSRLDAGSG
jgi:hypothetical protein